MRGLLILIVGLLILLTACGSSKSLKTTIVKECTATQNGIFPDSTCTPGMVNSNVTQATIGQTICKSGWATTIRPAENVTEPEKFTSMKQYGDSTTKGQVSKYEYDHLVPLEVGGDPNSVQNLWPELHSVILNNYQYGSYTKDKVENALNSLVCKGAMPLAQAQQVFITNWTNGLKYTKSKIPALPNS